MPHINAIQARRLLCGYCAQQVRILFAFSESTVCVATTAAHAYAANCTSTSGYLHHSSIARFHTMVSIRHIHPWTRVYCLSSPVVAWWKAIACIHMHKQQGHVSFLCTIYMVCQQHCSGVATSSPVVKGAGAWSGISNMIDYTNNRLNPSFVVRHS